MNRPILLSRDSSAHQPAHVATHQLQGKRVGMVLFSYYPEDPRPRRAAEALASCGMDVDLICLREEAQEPKHQSLNGVSIRRVPIKRRRGGIFGYIYQYLAFLLFSSAIIVVRSFFRRYDLIYVHNMPDFLVLSGLIPKAFGAKVVLDLHDPMPELMRTIFDLPEHAKSVRLLEHVEKWSIRFADSVVTVNRACAKLFGSRSCVPEKISVVMNSPDEEIFRFRLPNVSARTQEGLEPFVVMYHGSLVERNGLDLAVEAFALVSTSIPEAELRIYGARNAYLDRVMESARNKGLERKVHYLGPKPLENIVEAIEQCDVGIIPNKRNIFTELNTPTRIFEYLALGKPAIAPQATGICDYFDDDSLLFFELGNAEDLARKIEYVFHHPNKTLEIIRRGQEVHRKHTWLVEKHRLTNLVSDLLSDTHPKVTGADAESQPTPPSND
jgi:glycosyltransferase involved in cell wall biosynthesis